MFNLLSYICILNDKDMAYTKGNIIGVEFTTQQGTKVSYKVIEQTDKDGNHYFEQRHNAATVKTSLFCNTDKLIRYLNNGTWAVKTSKV